jgi:hypothetical protein
MKTDVFDSKMLHPIRLINCERELQRERGNKGRISECFFLYACIDTLWRECGDKRSNLVRRENNENRCS